MRKCKTFENLGFKDVKILIVLALYTTHFKWDQICSHLKCVVHNHNKRLFPQNVRVMHHPCL